MWYSTAPCFQTLVGVQCVELMKQHMCTMMGAMVPLYLNISMWYVVCQYSIKLFWGLQCRELTKQDFTAEIPPHQMGNSVYTCSVGMQSISQAVMYVAIRICRNQEVCWAIQSGLAQLQSNRNVH